MVTKRKTSRKAAPRRRVYAARRAAPRRRTKSGVTMIPGAMATAALVAVNVGKVMPLYHAINNNGNNPKLAQMIGRTCDGITGKNSWVHGKLMTFVSSQALITDAVAVAGGYVAGEVVKRYAPGVIKRPLGKIAKKIPKVI